MLSIVYKPICDLIPYANNSRTHSAAQVAQVAASINEFGFTNPVLIDDAGSIIAGHGRVQAAKKLAMDEIPTITLSGLSDEQKRAYVIADNQLALNAGWDLDSLRAEIELLNTKNFNIEVLGFDDDFMAGLLDINCGIPELPEGERDPFQKKTFTLHDEQVALIDDAVMLARTNPLVDTGINDNTNGNALTLICQEWLSVRDA